MDCSERRAQVALYLDGELTPAESVDLEQHLAECAACRAYCRSTQAISRRLQTALPYYEAPTAMRRKVASLNAGDDIERPRAAARGARALEFAAMLLLGVALGGGGTWSWLQQRSEGTVQQAVLDAYVRAQQTPGRLTDVTSADRHQLKPYFTGKLDFAPPVEDFAAAGFPLWGGRLDYLNQRPVAALLYRHQQHVIQLIIWPEPKIGDFPPRNNVRRGYQLWYWQRDGLRAYALSDLNEADMQRFSELAYGLSNAVPETPSLPQEAAPGEIQEP